MREKPDAERKRIDLNVPQVAGSALAAVIAAKLASSFGVYGTILGAGVVSVIATCGGSVFQHFFRRTGEQLRVAKTPAAVSPLAGPPAEGEYSPGTVYRARVRSWRRPVIAAALVFGVTMGGITTYELVSGSSFSGGSGTTVGDAVVGRKPAVHRTDDPGQLPSHTSPGDGTSPDDGHSPGSTPESGAGAESGSGSGSDGGTADPASPSPSASPDGTADGDQAGPAPTPSGSAGAPTTPAPSASSRSGTADPGRDDPAAP
ncbi:hypothetical protein [Streptomyces malaysiense]|uniref:Uncharacterized protein n=1 Tax=Streptomyces malaysiense TaxID=1428626 RepID=A0A1J4PQY2_9ACTN|nr:hypothetical protein [Streptomyces malaysiense]OIK23323.1 hypothetical protein VT52_033000 [Streptomyces malaysiense]